MNPERTMLLQRSEIARLLTLDECRAAVEEGFRMLGEGKAEPPGILGIRCEAGGFHIKAGRLGLRRDYFAAKVNANFPENRVRFGLPTIQGLILLFDATNGQVLAALDSSEITARRTAAATAVAAKYLAQADAAVITICGCGCQGEAQLRALTAVLPLSHGYAYDLDTDRAQRYASELGRELGIRLEAVGDLRAATRRSEVCVTCTTSRQPLLGPQDIVPGTFVAAVGADNPEKQELHAALLAQNKVVVDLLEQCIEIGDLHHAIASGLTSRAHVHAELGEIVAGKRPGRTSRDEVLIFDSTGIALQDVAAAAVTYEKALQRGSVAGFDFAA